MPLNFAISLPNELVSKILGYADYIAITACRRVCHRLKNIVDTTASLRYIVELGASGMCDGPPDAVCPADRLRRLEGSQVAWKSSAWSQPEGFPYSKKIFLFPMALSGNLVVLKGLTFGSRHMGELLLLRFPSKARGIPEKLWYLNLDCEHTEAMSLDESQDLLVFSCLPNIHIRTLSSGCVHPLSNALGLIDSGTNFAEYENFSLSIHDDRLALTSIDHHIMPLIMVWNWKSGEQIAKFPCGQRFFGCSFLDRNNILFSYRMSGKEQKLCFQVANFGSLNTTDEAAIRFYHFELHALDLQPGNAYCLSANTLPSNTSDSCFPGLFHSEPSSRLLGLEVETPMIRGSMGGGLPLRVLYVPHDVLLDYIASHPSDTDAVVVPWEAWAPRNARIFSLPNPSPDRYLGSKIVCGMHAVTEPPMIVSQGDQTMLRIMDYHPRRIVHNSVTQDTHLRGAVESHKRLGFPGTALSWQEVGVSTDEELPYAPKDIPLPGQLQLESIKCVLGEDVVAMFEYSLGTSGDFGHRIKKVFYHPI